VSFSLELTGASPPLPFLRVVGAATGRRQPPRNSSHHRTPSCRSPFFTSSSPCYGVSSVAPSPCPVRQPPSPRAFPSGTTAPRPSCPRWAPQLHRCAARCDRTGRAPSTCAHGLAWLISLLDQASISRSSAKSQPNTVLLYSFSKFHFSF
jgi:hypothetical protein